MASGDTLYFWTAMQGKPVDQGDKAAWIGGRNTIDQHHVIKFRDSTYNQEVVFKGIMPQHYTNEIGVALYIHFAMASAVAGAVVWSVMLERISPLFQDIDSSGWSLANHNTVTVPATAGLMKIAATNFSPGTDMDSIEKGNGFRVRIRRYATDASDTATGNAELWAVEMRER